MPAQDPAEPFDLFDRDGTPLGRTKPRALVHRDGDWHRSLHLWVVLQESPPMSPLVVLQRRSRAKDTWPGAIDVAVTGHYRAGETLSEVLREAEEEIGLRVRPDEVTRLGVRRRSHQAEGLVDNELQDVFATVQHRALTTLAPGEEEVDGLLGVAPGDLALLVERRTGAIDAKEVRPGGALISSRLTESELIPADDAYYERALASLRSVLEGVVPSPWSLMLED